MLIPRFKGAWVVVVSLVWASVELTVSLPWVVVSDITVVVDADVVFSSLSSSLSRALLNAYPAPAPILIIIDSIFVLKMAL